MAAARADLRLLVLLDVALDQADADGVAAVRPRGHRGAMAAPGRNDQDHGQRSGRRHEVTVANDRQERSMAPVHDRQRERGADRRDQHRHAVDAEEARELGDRQDRRLAVPEQHPGKPGEDVRAPELGGDPHRRAPPSAPMAMLRTRRRTTSAKLAGNSDR